MLNPLARGAAVGLDGVQLIVAPAGNPGMVQVADTAGLGPLFWQEMMPVTVCPAFTVVGNVLPVVAISATAVTVATYGLVLLAVLGSAVVEAAATVAVTGPLPGAT
jgi:hypothetical protein